MIPVEGGFFVFGLYEIIGWLALIFGLMTFLIIYIVMTSAVAMPYLAAKLSHAKRMIIQLREGGDLKLKAAKVDFGIVKTEDGIPIQDYHIEETIDPDTEKVVKQITPMQFLFGGVKWIFQRGDETVAFDPFRNKIQSPAPEFLQRYLGIHKKKAEEKVKAYQSLKEKKPFSLNIKLLIWIAVIGLILLVIYNMLKMIGIMP